MSESTVRFKFESELDGMLKWTKGVQDAKKAVAELHAEMAKPPPVGDVSPSMDTPMPSAVARAKQAAGQTGAPYSDPVSPTSGGRPSPAPGGGRGGGGGGFGMPSARLPNVPGQSVMTRGGRSIVGSPLASTAAGIGLGAGIAGFMLNSAQEYMQLSTVITQMRRQFRGAREDSTSWGYSLGYVRSQAAALSQQLGQSTNTVSRGQANNAMGLARFTGVDLNAAGGFVGRMGLLTGSSPGASGLMRTIGSAEAENMGHGRMTEYLQSILQLAEMQMQSGGSASLDRSLSMSQMNRQVFGTNDPRGQGSMGVGFQQRLQGVMTGQGPMRSFMLRAMGYGTDDGPGYIDAMKRLEKGVTDPDNLVDFFSYFQERGLGRGAQFRALQSVAGGSLRAHEIEALVSSLGTRDGLQRYKDEVAGGGDYETLARAGLSSTQQSALDQGGMAGLARASQSISLGEVSRVQLEGVRMQAGQTTAQALLDIREAVINGGTVIKTAIEYLTGANLGATLTDLTGSVRDISERMAAASEAGTGIQATGAILQRGAAIYQLDGAGNMVQFYKDIMMENTETQHPEYFAPLGKP